MLEGWRTGYLAGVVEHHDDPGAGHRHGSEEPEAEHQVGRWAWRHRLGPLGAPHSHDAVDKTDAALEASAEGRRALKLSFLILAGTAALQGVVVVLTGSVALLGDTLHNLADALTAVPIGLAFVVGRRAPTRRYTYGFGRAEDLAGVAVVAAIAASTVLAGYASIDRLIHPAPVHRLWAVAGAAVVGFCGNELAARYRIGVGRRIGSAALVADGHHARTDGFVSLGVLLGALGMAAGLAWADAGVGLAITVAITVVLWGAARDVWRRLMDAVDPELLQAAEQALVAVPGVQRIGQVRMRWIGHALRADAEVVVDESLTVG